MVNLAGKCPVTGHYHKPCVYTFLHACMHAYTYIHTYIHTYVHSCMHTCILYGA